LNETAVLEGLAQMLNAVHQIQSRNENNQRQQGEQMHEFALLLESNLGISKPRKPIIVDSADKFGTQNPDVGLLQYLYSYLSDPIAIDVGAHRGAVTERLLETGYSVYAFEPYPPSYAELEHKHKGGGDLHTFPLAIGPADGKVMLHVASDVSGKNDNDPTLFNTLVEHPLGHDFRFTQTIPVEVRSLASLVQSGELPKRAGVLKIDTEGLDLEVIRGMGQLRPSVVMAEFWDPAHEFGKSGKGRAADLITEMKMQGYAWHLVVYHLDASSTISYYHNRRDTVPGSWGNVVFFENQRLLAEALRWIEDVLPPTLFR
jgi:FkbM family methyltransferase